MSIDLSNYNIKFFKGSTFKLDFSYTTSTDVAINLSGRTAKMQVRRSPYSSELIAELYDDWPVGSVGIGSSGDFLSGQGVTGGTGGIALNYDDVNGDIHVEIDPVTSSNMPVGKHSYDIQLIKSSDSTQTTILRGELQVLPSTLW